MAEEIIELDSAVEDLISDYLTVDAEYKAIGSDHKAMNLKIKKLLGKRYGVYKVSNGKLEFRKTEKTEVDERGLIEELEKSGLEEAVSTVVTKKINTEVLDDLVYRGEFSEETFNKYIKVTESGALYVK